MFGDIANLPDVRPADLRPSLNNGFENSIFVKIASCVPVLGAIPSIIAKHVIGRKLEILRYELRHQQGPATPEQNRRAVELLKAERDYTICSLVNSVLAVAAVVALFVLGFFGLAPLIVGAVATGITIAIQSWSIHSSNKMVKEVNANGAKSVHHLFNPTDPRLIQA